MVLHKRKGAGRFSQINNRGSGLLKGSLGTIIIGGVTQIRKTLVEGGAGYGAIYSTRFFL